MQPGKEKAQSAMEYLISYGWMILIIAIVLAVLYVLGIFNPNNIVSNSCVLPGQFSCSIAAFGGNGNLQVSIGQYTQSKITITSIGCSTNQTAKYQTSESQSLNTGSNATFTIACYSGSAAFSGSLGSVYHGYIVINYTDTASGLTHTISGPITLRTSEQNVFLPITYAYSGNTASSSLTLSSGYTAYICVAGNYFCGITPGFSSDVQSGPSPTNTCSAIGRQSSNICSVTTSYGVYESFGGIGLSTSESPTIYTYNAIGQSISTQYTTSKTWNLVVITVACGDFPCTSVTAPSGCSTAVSENIGTSGYGTSAIYLCSSQPAGTYTISGGSTIGNAYISVAVYEYA